jgi:hypothetical protein
VSRAHYKYEAGVNIELSEPDCYLHLVELVRKTSRDTDLQKVILTVAR